MTTPTLFKEYIWLVNTIRRAGRISFADLQEKWIRSEISGGVGLARATFNRHKDAIEEIFSIYIECDRKDGYRYYIGNAEDLDTDSVQNWMLSTMTVNDMIAESKSLHDRILMQKIPFGDFLPILVEAMQEKRRVAVKYRKYGSDTVSEVDFEPYCIKLFNQRWYVLAHFHRDATPEKEERDYFGVYAFDRIQEIEMTDVKFKMRKDFDAQVYFSECFGVMVGDGTPVERIVLRAFGNQRFYLRDLPLHPTQKEIVQGEDYVDFEMKLRPTIDFSRHVLSLSDQVKVLEPSSFVEQIKKLLKESLSMYDK